MAQSEIWPTWNKLHHEKGTTGSVPCDHTWGVCGPPSFSWLSLDTSEGGSWLYTRARKGHPMRMQTTNGVSTIAFYLEAWSVDSAEGWTWVTEIIPKSTQMGRFNTLFIIWRERALQPSKPREPPPGHATDYYLAYGLQTASTCMSPLYTKLARPTCWGFTLLHKRIC